MEDQLATPRAARRPRLRLAALLLLTIAAGCSNFVGTTAKSFMKHIRTDPDPNKRYLAYSALGKNDVFETQELKDQAVELLVQKLEEGREPLATRVVICRVLGDIGDPKARSALIKMIGHPEGVVRAAACRALGKIGRPEDASLLARVMTIDNLEDCRMAAIEGLGEMKTNDPRVILILIEGMEHDDPAIRMASLTALRNISGTDLGLEPGPWRKHYEAIFAQPAPVSPAEEAVSSRKLPADDGKTRKIDPGVVKSTRP